MQHLRGFVLAEAGADLTDGQLLESFIRERAEGALATLVHRHGPMVWGVCRRILSHVNDAEDAFQATFLVLLRKAKSIQPRELVANWLYGVAHQTALKARATAAKRKGRERQVVNKYLGYPLMGGCRHVAAALSVRTQQNHVGNLDWSGPTCLRCGRVDAHAPPTTEL